MQITVTKNLKVIETFLFRDIVLPYIAGNYMFCQPLTAIMNAKKNLFSISFTTVIFQGCCLVAMEHERVKLEHIIVYDWHYYILETTHGER
jgi:hypothetical protein